jgi:D-alanyl-D-alanine dipeptidase
MGTQFDFSNRSHAYTKLPQNIKSNRQLLKEDYDEFNSLTQNGGIII